MFNKTIKGMMFAAVLFIGLPSVVSAYESTYSRCAIVIDVDSDKVLVQDLIGNTWTFFGDGIKTGDKVRLTMNDRHTENIRDDEIVKIKKL